MEEISIEQLKDMNASWKEAFKDHAKSDNQSFNSIESKLDSIMDRNSDVHTKLYTELVGITKELEGLNKRMDIANGRTAKIEGMAQVNQKDITRIMTSFSNVLNTMNDIKADERDKRENATYWKRWVITFLIIGMSGFVTSMIWVVLQKTDIVDISIVPEQTYNDISNLTEPYENR